MYFLQNFYAYAQTISELAVKMILEKAGRSNIGGVNFY